MSVSVSTTGVQFSTPPKLRMFSTALSAAVTLACWAVVVFGPQAPGPKIWVISVLAATLLSVSCSQSPASRMLSLSDGSIRIFWRMP